MRVVIAGGGTGGHLFPGIAIAREFMKVDERSRILFMGTKRGIESRIIPREGFDIRYISIGGLNRVSLIKKLSTLVKIPLSIMQSVICLLGFRPHLVIGVGGYASAPVGAAASLLRIPLVIQEQNLEPGSANNLLGKVADRIFTSFEETASFFKKERVCYTGNPIRGEIVEGKTFEQKKRGDKFGLLLFGGSQGARAINEKMVEALPFLESVKERLSIIHQAGASTVEETERAYNERGFDAHVTAFIDDMGAAYEEADFVVSRSGATSLAEITAAGKAALLIPFPFAVNNHQERNARQLENAGGAKVLLEKELTGEGLAREIKRLMENEKALHSMEENSLRLGRPKAAQEIVRLCYQVVNEAYPGGKKL